MTATPDSARPGGAQSERASDWPMVSAIIPTHQRPELVRRAVEAVVAQTYPGPIECIVAHDGEPADLTLEALSRNDRGAPRLVRAIVNTHDRGQTGARECALENARGEYVAWCDDDDRWHRDKVERQMVALAAEPTAVGAACGLRWEAPDGKATLQSAPLPLVSRQDLLRHGPGALGLHWSSLVVPRGVFESLGGGGRDGTSAVSGSQGEGSTRKTGYGRVEDYVFFLQLSTLGPIVTVADPLVDVRWDPVSAFTPERWRTIAETMQMILRDNPDFERIPTAKGRMCHRIATNYSLAGMHGPAWIWSVRAVRYNPRDIRAWLILAAASVRVRAKWPLGLLRRLRRLRGDDGPVRVVAVRPSSADS